MDALAELIGESPPIDALRKQVLRLARSPASARPPNVLIQGETGTGKGLVAALLHRLGPRAKAAFVDVNCAAIPETLLEAELFGYEQGAFTDARRAKPGLFQMAHRGTIFLDEVGLLPLSLQAKLLKVLEERSVRRLGAVRNEPVDVWVISATNAELPAAIRARQFRADLYHRLAVVSLDLPPLRERPGDVLLLAEHFLARASEDYGLPRKRLGPEARSRLLGHTWPGNIRELANAIERAVLLTEGVQLRLAPSHLEAAPSVAPPTVADASLAARGEVPAEPAPSEAPGQPPPALPAPGAPATFIEEAMPEQPGGSIRWERRRVTLLRARLTGVDSSQTPASSGRWLEMLVDKVKSFGGLIQDLSPDGVTAGFGLDPVEDSARRAAHAAMAIQRASERLRGDRVEAPTVTVALHTSQVAVGRVNEGAHIADEERRQLGAVLEELIAVGRSGAVLVSAATAPFLERRLELVEVGDPAVSAYRLVGQEGAGLGLWGGMGRFVGRHHELQMLRLISNSVLKGHGQIAALVGEPGVGKSRLAWEFTHAEARRAWRVLETGAMSYARATPYLPVIQLLRHCFGIDPLDDAIRVGERVAAQVRGHDTAPKQALPALLALLDVRVDDPRWNDLDPPQRRQATLDAVRWLLLEESRRRPLLLVVEDAHWIDPGSQAVLDTLVDALPTSPILLLVTYRPEYQHRWTTLSFYTQLSIDALPHENAAELLHGLLGDHPSLIPLASRLLEWTDGNPFFLEESVRALIEAGTLEGERGAYRLVRPVPSIQVPATVQDVLATRIDRLPAETLRLLRSAAVIGKDVPRPLLAAIAGLSDEALEQRLGQLRTAELLYQTGVLPEAEYSFKHTLTHEVAYSSVPKGERVALHARILALLEARPADRRAESADRLAHHASRGEVWDKAVDYLRQAGSRALARSANREAVACFEQALDALAHLPESTATRELAIDLRFDLRLAFFPLGELESGLRHLQQAERLAEALGDQRRLGWASAYMGNQQWLRGEFAEARALGERARAIAMAIGDVPLRVVTSYYLGLAYQASGDLGQAESSFASIIHALRGDLARERFGVAGFPAVICRCWLAWCLAERGQFDEAIAHGREAICLAEEFDHRFSLAWALWGLAHVALIREDVRLAAPLLERSRTLSVEGGHLVWPHLHAWAFGELRMLSGEAADAESLLQESLGVFDARGLGVWQSLVLVRLGEAFMLAGRLAEARATGERALSLARRRIERSHEAWALRLLGDVAARGDVADVEAAEPRYRAALALGEELGMRPLTAHCQLGLAAMYRRIGRRGPAAEHLGAAQALYAEMGMAAALDRAEALAAGSA